MKLHLNSSDSLYTFTASGDGYVEVNHRRFEANLVVLPTRVVQAWSAATFETLAEADFALLAELDADIVLVGTGPKCRFPPGRLLRPIAEKNRGIEFMDVQAACRTYNILVGEGRKVACALLFA